MWDWMFNLQLWSASGLAQIVKWMIPYGWIWTPILDDVSRRSNLLELSSIDCSMMIFVHQITFETLCDLISSL
jgi:hypothetical protein